MSFKSNGTKTPSLTSFPAKYKLWHSSLHPNKSGLGQPDTVHQEASRTSDTNPTVINQPVGRAVTRSSLEREVRGSNLGPFRSNTVLPTLRHFFESCIARAQWCGDKPRKPVTRFGVLQRIWWKIWWLMSQLQGYNLIVFSFECNMVDEINYKETITYRELTHSWLALSNKTNAHTPYNSKARYEVAQHSCSMYNCICAVAVC